MHQLLSDGAALKARRWLAVAREKAKRPTADDERNKNGNEHGDGNRFTALVHAAVQVQKNEVTKTSDVQKDNRVEPSSEESEEEEEEEEIDVEVASMLADERDAKAARKAARASKRTAKTNRVRANGAGELLSVRLADDDPRRGESNEKSRSADVAATATLQSRSNPDQESKASSSPPSASSSSKPYKAKRRGFWGSARQGVSNVGYAFEKGTKGLGKGIVQTAKVAGTVLDVVGDVVGDVLSIALV
jgi:hypothetical protein